MNLKNLIWIAMPAMLGAACKQDKYAETASRTVFFDKSAMDTTVRPGDDFFRYAGGTWMKKTQIPASDVGVGSFYTLFDENQTRLHGILDEMTKTEHDKGSKEQKIGDLYLSGMDTVAIEKLGYSPVKPLLDKINAVKNSKELVQLSADGFKDGDGFLFGFYVSPDDKNSSKNMAQFTQSGLGLPNRDYYFNTDEASKKIRAAYLTYITKLFSLSGTDPVNAAKKAADVLKLETAIAKSHSTPVELRDPVKNYNKFSVADIQKQLPDIDLKDVFKRMDIGTDTILVGQPNYYKTLNTLLKTQPIELWKTKLSFEALNGAAPVLNKNFRDAYFEFFGKVLNGQKQQKPRWKTMLSRVDAGLGELLGQVYVEKYFTPEAKKRMQELVDNLQGVYKSRIEKLDWMSSATKEKAVAKLTSFTKKIGYPDKWKNYDDVEISKSAFYQNLVSIAKHDYKDMVKRVNKPVDRTEWGMTPPTINAYYNPSFNEIVFPAGILQFPFFDKDADDAINYGAIGAVIGHEMTHGFDDQGSQYDKDGNLKVWWTPEDAAKFKVKTTAVAGQYDKFVVLKDMHVNGNLTLGENLADIGGVAIAYQAFKNTDQGKGTAKIDGLSPDQRFFLSFAQVWRIKLSDESIRKQVNTDPHSPAEYRVNGPLSNTDAWYKAFDIKPGDKLYRPENERAKIW